ncbi:MAG: hypothetical protein KGJ59_10805 [Bacteroidota bacterium]|nr:hypothetical protein [Bacteroidota bacterium]
MPYSKSEGKIAIGLFVDGLDIKFAHISFKNKQFKLEEVKTVNLVKKLEELHASVESAAPAVEGFEMTEAALETPELAEPTTTEEGEETEKENNGSVLFNLLSDFPSGTYKFVYSVSEPSVYYQTFEDALGLEGVKLKKALAEQIAQVRSVKPSLDAVEYIPAADGQILSIVREDGLGFLTLLEDIREFIGRLPQVPFLETSDVSLMNMVRANYDVGEEEISVIVYIGNEFSRLIFMKGQYFFHFAPVISEGKATPNIENTLYSRILLEQDSAGITHVDRIFLAGEAHKVQLKQFLAPLFPESPIEYLIPVTLDTNVIPDSVVEITSEYAVPISAALRALEPKNPFYYSIDLLPFAFHEAQKVFKLAWHGYLLLLLLFAFTLYFTTHIISRNDDIRSARADLQQKQYQLSENQRLQTILNNLRDENQRYVSALALYDAMVPNYNRWSNFFYGMTNDLDDLKSVWIESVATRADQSLELTGFTTDRSKIPVLANMFQKTALQSVELQEIRGQMVYKFDMVISQISSD